MKITRTLFGLAFLFFHVVGTSGQVLIPLAEDNTWTYEKRIKEGDAEISIDTVVNRVIESLFLNDATWYSVQEFGDHFIVKNSPLGQYEIDTGWVNDEGLYEETLFFKTPGSLAQEYLVYGANVVTVDKDPMRLTTPAGTFDYYRYTIRPGEDPPIRFFISPGVGTVRYEWEEDQRLEIYELISFTLN